MFNKLKEKIAEPDFQKGKKLDSQKKYKDAINSYQRAVAIYPEYVDAYRNLDYDYYHINDYQNDLKTMKKIITLDPNNSGNYSDLGITYDSLHEFNKAIASYEKAISVGPQHEEYYVSLAKDYARIKDYKSEIINYKRAINFTPKCNYFNCIGIAYDNLKDYKQAINFYKEAINKENNDNILYDNLSITYHNMHDYKDEAIALKQAIRINPKAIYYNNLGVAYHFLNNDTAAKECYQKAISMDNNSAQYYENLSDVETNLQNKIMNLKDALNIDPNRTSCINKLGDSYYSLGNNYYNNKKYEDARKNYQNATTLDPNNAKYYKYLGDSEGYLKNYGLPAAVKEYSKALRLNHNYEQALSSRSDAYYQLGDYHKEIEDYTKLIQMAPHNDVYFNNLGYAYHLIKDNKNAIYYYKQSLSVNKNNIKDNNKSICLDNLALSEQVAAKNSDNEQDSLKYYKNSILHCQQAVKIRPKYLDAYSIMVNDYMAIKKYDKAIKILNKLLKINNQNSYYYRQLGRTYSLMDNNKKAVIYYRKYLSFNPKLSNQDKATCYKRLADAESKIHSNYSTSDYRQASKLDPNNSTYQQALKKNIHQIQQDFNFDDVDQYNENIDYMTQLKRLVGLKDVSNQLSKFITRYEVEKAKSNNNNHGMMHLVFEGAPGTGKTLVAKLFSHLLAQEGMVQPNRYVEMNAGDFRSKYQGQGTSKVEKAIKNSINGVLFIDEAYILGSSEDSVKEASQKMLTEIQDHKDDIVVILAGYRDRMKNFFNNGNEGLLSRFPDVITFPNYSNEDCLKVFYADLIQHKMKISSENNTQNVLDKEFTNWISVDRREKGNSFGNARTAKNCCQKLIDNVDARVGTEYRNELTQLAQEHSDKLVTITIKDVKRTFDNHYKESKHKKEHDYLTDLNSLIGLNSVKVQLQVEINQVKANKRLGNDSGHGNINSIFEGNPGTGKTTVAKLLGKILYQKNIAQNDNFKHVNATKLQSTLIGGSAKRMRSYIQDAMGGVLFIDEAYALRNKHMQPVVETLLSAAEDYKNDLVIILAGYTKQMEDLRNYVNPGFKSRFRKVIKFPNYNSTECQQIFELFMHKNNLKFDTKTTHALLKKYLKQVISIKKSEDQSNFANARTVRNIYDDLQDTFDNRIATMPEAKFKQLKANDSVRNITTKDVKKTFDKYNVTNQAQPKSTSALDKLNNLIGLTNVKNQVKTYIRKRKMDIVLNNNKDNGIDLVFEGSPGTGKTTVARLLAQILYDIGMVKTTKFKEIQGSDLTGQYLGQTKTKARKIIQSALGGVLFIDEAYTLAHNPSDSGGTNDYKDDAIAELVAEMENHRNDLAVIMAGYTQPMNYLFKYSNPGLTRRFKDRIIFKNYNNDDCFRILKLMLYNNNVKVDSVTNSILKKQFYQAVTIDRDREGSRFGNGGYVRNIADKLFAAKNNRLAILPMKTLFTIKKDNPKKLHMLTTDDVDNTFAHLSHNN